MTFELAVDTWFYDCIRSVFRKFHFSQQRSAKLHLENLVLYSHGLNTLFFSVSGAVPALNPSSPSMWWCCLKAFTQLWFSHGSLELGIVLFVQPYEAEWIQWSNGAPQLPFLHHFHQHLELLQSEAILLQRDLTAAAHGGDTHLLFFIPSAH